MTKLTKTVLITGASSGIGETTAKLLAQNGASVLLGARRTGKLETIVKGINANNGCAKYHALDVTSRESCTEFANYAINEFGCIDALVCNAGVMLLSPFCDYKYEEWESMIKVNYFGVINCLMAILPIMKLQRHGTIINVNSTAGYRVMKNSSVYSSTKFAIRALFDGIRKEESDNGIKLTVISPGPTKTELLSNTSDSQIKASLTKYVEDAGLESEDVAKTVLFSLTLPDSASIDELIISPTKKL